MDDCNNFQNHVLYPLCHDFDVSSISGHNASGSGNSNGNDNDNDNNICNSHTMIGSNHMNEKLAIHLTMQPQPSTSSSPLASDTTAVMSTSNTIGRIEFIESIVKRCKEEQKKVRLSLSKTPMSPSSSFSNSTSSSFACEQCLFWRQVGAKYLSKEMITFRSMTCACTCSQSMTIVDQKWKNGSKEQLQLLLQFPYEEGGQQKQSTTSFISVSEKNAKLLYLNGNKISEITSSQSKSRRADSDNDYNNTTTVYRKGQMTFEIHHGDVITVSIPSSKLLHVTNSYQNNNQNGEDSIIPRKQGALNSTVDAKMSFVFLSLQQIRIKGTKIMSKGCIDGTVSSLKREHQEEKQKSQEVKEIDGTNKATSSDGFFATLRKKRKRTLEHVVTNGNEEKATKVDEAKVISKLHEEAFSEESPLLSMHHFSMVDNSIHHDSENEENCMHSISMTMPLANCDQIVQRNFQPWHGQGEIEERRYDNDNPLLGDLSIKQLRRIRDDIILKRNEKGSTTTTHDISKRRMQEIFLTMALQGKEEATKISARRVLPKLLKKTRVSNEMLQTLNYNNTE